MVGWSGVAEFEAGLRFPYFHFSMDAVGREVVHEEEILDLLELNGEESDPPLTVFGL